MSRRTMCIGDGIDLQGKLTIDVPFYSTLSGHLSNQTGGLCSIPSGNIAAVTVNGIRGISSKGLNEASPCWYNTTGQDSAMISSILPGNREYTLSFYICPRGIKGHGWFFGLINRNAESTGMDMASSHYGSPTKFKPFWNSETDITPPASNRWTHVAVCYGIGTGRVYYNGIQQIETEIPITSSPISHGFALREGASDGGNTSNAIFRQIKFYNGRSLFGDEVIALYEQESNVLANHPLS